MQQSEQRASGDVLGHNGKLAGIIQTGPYKLDDAGVIEATQDGDFSAEHVYVRLGAVGVGSVPADNSRGRISNPPIRGEKRSVGSGVLIDVRVPFDGNYFISALASVDLAKGA